MLLRFFIRITILILLFCSVSFAKETRELLNVSYEPTYDFYRQYNDYFVKYWKNKTNEELKIYQSHGGSGKKARAIIEGLEADVVTLALAYDIDKISNMTKLLDRNWQNCFPNNSSPYFSTIVLVVRKGNPKYISDWDDLIRDDVSVITPNPKTSGGARWNYLGALSYAKDKFSGNKDRVFDFMSKLLANVEIYDSGARGSGITFVKRNMGDVLIAWENEALLLQEKFPNQFEIITPSVSILAEIPVAVVKKYAKKHHNYDLANEYLKQLYSEEAAKIIMQNFYRPNSQKLAAKYGDKFPNLDLVSIADLGGWNLIHRRHFEDGGMFDFITKNNLKR